MNYKLPLAFILVSYHLVLGSEEFTNDEITENTDDQSLNRVRRGLSMLRLGRGLQMLRLGKRAPLMLRLGRSAGDSMSNDDFQYLLNLLRNDRSVPLPRYGKDLAWQYMLMNALKDAEMNEMYDGDEPDYRFGYELGSPAERQIRPAPRPGRFRRSVDDVENQQGGDEMVRAVPLPRFGKELPEEKEQKYEIVRLMPITQDSKEADDYDESEDVDETAVKRAMHMLRLGRGMRMLRLGKRPMDSDEEVSEADKRALRLLRLGKRPFKMLRLGRSDNEEGKRALRLLRLGKKSNSDLES